jgi:hypothetical protein
MIRSKGMDNTELKEMEGQPSEISRRLRWANEKGREPDQKEI